jgi:hypothetical protein
MAHWAEIDENNIVLRVTVGDNNDSNGDEGYQWLLNNLGGTWIKTSYNSYGGVHYTYDEYENKIPSGKPHLRYNFAGVGFTYDEENDAFIPNKPEYPEGINWVLNSNTFLWELPE